MSCINNIFQPFFTIVFEVFTHWVSLINKCVTCCNFTSMKYYEDEPAAADDDDDQPPPLEWDDVDSYHDPNIGLFSKREKIDMLQKEYETQMNRLFALKICEHTFHETDEYDLEDAYLFYSVMNDTQAICDNLKTAMHIIHQNALTEEEEANNTVVVDEPNEEEEETEEESKEAEQSKEPEEEE